MSAPTFDITDALIDDIYVVGERRPVDAGAVTRLIDSIKGIGLQTPITVRQSEVTDPDSGEVLMAYALIAGRHRLEAYRSLGKDRIPAIVRDCDEVDAQLWEIAENLHRAELTVLERDEQVAKWVELNASKLTQSVSVSGGRGNKGSRSAAEQIGVNREDARRAAKVASLSEDAKDAAREAGLDDNRTALLAAAKAEPDQQAAVIRDYAEQKQTARNKIDGDVKARAAREVAEMLAEHIPGEWWDALKANLYAAGASNIAHELTNVTGQSIMDRRFA